eukprot:1110003-Prorocentrum_minimum.AAC.3
MWCEYVCGLPSGPQGRRVDYQKEEQQLHQRLQPIVTSGVRHEAGEGCSCNKHTRPPEILTR